MIHVCTIIIEMDRWMEYDAEDMHACIYSFTMSLIIDEVPFEHSAGVVVQDPDSILLIISPLAHIPTSVHKYTHIYIHAIRIIASSIVYDDVMPDQCIDRSSHHTIY